MGNDVEFDVAKLGRAAAIAVAGPDAIGQVEVEDSLDSLDRPAYTFHFLIDPDRAGQSMGIIRMRLGQRLVDDLMEHGDERHPIIHFYSNEDWAKRTHA